MAYWYGVFLEGKELAAFSHPYEKEIAKRGAEEMAERINKNENVRCEVKQIK